MVLEGIEVPEVQNYRAVADAVTHTPAHPTGEEQLLLV